MFSRSFAEKKWENNRFKEADLQKRFSRIMGEVRGFFVSVVRERV